MIAFTGQLGGLSAAFSRALARSLQNAKKTEEIVALDRTPNAGWGVNKWRLGSMISKYDTRQMLKDVSRVYYFCLTPPLESRTDEGNGIDVALCDAMNFSREVGDDVEVVLVTRIFPEDGRQLGCTYNFWREIRDLFKETVKRLQIVYVSPIWSEEDSVINGLITYARHNKIDRKDLRIFNLINPLEMNQFIEHMMGIHNAPWVDGAVHCLEGSHAIPYEMLMQCIQTTPTRSSSRRLVSNLIRRRDLLSHNDEALFRQAFAFHSASDDAIHKESSAVAQNTVIAQCRDFVHELYDDSVFNLACAQLGSALRNEKVKTEFQVASKTRNYVFNIGRVPRRPVAEIANLFTMWLPRYFQRLVNLENVGDSRLMVRVARFPLVEFEKIEEAWNCCRLLLRYPLSGSLEARMQLTVTVTGTQEKPREILIVCEEGPKSSGILLMSRGVMASFGRYLRDYGVAE